MDWSTLLAGAGVSAVVSALVSLVAVRSITVRQARANEAEQARRAVRAATQPLINDLARYLYTARNESRRTEATSHMDDHAAVLKIRHAAAGLPYWRRYLVDRRCRRVFGRYWTNLAIDFPSNDSLKSWLVAAIKDREVSDGNGPLDGLMHRAYTRPAGDPLQKKLKRQLRRLSACR